jgi:hypothetical protein
MGICRIYRRTNYPIEVFDRTSIVGRHATAAEDENRCNGWLILSLQRTQIAHLIQRLTNEQDTHVLLPRCMVLVYIEDQRASWRGCVEGLILQQPIGPE